MSHRMQSASGIERPYTNFYNVIIEGMIIRPSCFFWYVAKMYVLKVCVPMCSYFSSIVVSIVILLDFPDDLIPNCIANFKTNFRQLVHKQHKKSWKSFGRRFVLRGQYALIINHKFLRCFISSSQIMIPSYPWSLGNDSWSSILGKCPAPIMHYASIIVFGS